MIVAVPSRRCRRRAILVALTAAFTACAPPAVQQTDAPQADAPTAAAGPPTAPAKAAPPRQSVKELPPSSPPLLGKAEQELARCIASYEDGAYKSAALQCRAALDMGLATRADQAAAHKCLAFMVCVSGREKACRDEFRKALDADPAFDLAPAEIGHPVWGPVLRSVKSEARAKAKP